MIQRMIFRIISSRIPYLGAVNHQILMEEQAALPLIPTLDCERRHV